MAWKYLLAFGTFWCDLARENPPICFFLKLTLVSLQNYWLHFFHQGVTRFLYSKLLLDRQILHFAPHAFNGNRLTEVSINGKNAPFDRIFNFDFLENNRSDLFHQIRKQFFCEKLINFCLLHFSHINRNMMSQKGWKFSLNWTLLFE